MVFCIDVFSYITWFIVVMFAIHGWKLSDLFPIASFPRAPTMSEARFSSGDLNSQTIAITDDLLFYL